MTKLTEEELNTALKMAAQMCDKKIDPFFIAKILLSYAERIKYFEDILKKADRYINRGMSDQERTHLILAIEKVKNQELLIFGHDRGRLGL